MQGTRLPDNEWLTRAADGEIKPGDYGRCFMEGSTMADEGHWDWFVCCPDGSTTRLWVNEDDKNGCRHILTEHDDCSITVGGSIMGGDIVPVVALIGEIKRSDGKISFWHGYLKHGVWESV